MMAQAQLATRIDIRVKKAIEKTCEARGLKIGRFVENALIDKLEELAEKDTPRGQDSYSAVYFASCQ